MFFFVYIPSDDGSKNKLNKWEYIKLWKRMGRIFKTLKIKLSDNPAIKTLGIYPNKRKNTKNNKKHMHPNAHSSIIYNSQVTEAT